MQYSWNKSVNDDKASDTLSHWSWAIRPSQSNSAGSLWLPQYGKKWLWCQWLPASVFVTNILWNIILCALQKKDTLSNQSLFSPVKAGKHWSKQSLNRINLLAKSDQLQRSFCYIADLILDKPTPNNNPIQDALGTSEALQ